MPAFSSAKRSQAVRCVWSAKRKRLGTQKHARWKNTRTQASAAFWMRMAWQRFIWTSARSSKSSETHLTSGIAISPSMPTSPIRRRGRPSRASLVFGSHASPFTYIWRRLAETTSKESFSSTPSTRMVHRPLARLRSTRCGRKRRRRAWPRSIQVAMV